MTLGGLAIAIGVVVDNGIITVENVVCRLQLNRNAAAPNPAIEVVFDAVQEILNTVVYATTILILIFLPIFMLQDLAGQIFNPLGVSYVTSLAASLVVAVTMVPALCYLLLDRKRCGIAASCCTRWEVARSCRIRRRSTRTHNRRTSANSMFASILPRTPICRRTLC
jgi:Cu/Ag efflux pump CusA